MSLKRLRAIVRGRVQHVGFRAWAWQKAEWLNLTGTVENLEDGSVEIIFQGDEKSVDEMKASLQKGSPLSLVKQIIFYNERIKEDETNFAPVY